MDVIYLGGSEIEIRERATAGGVEYDFTLDVPATGDRARVAARIDMGSPPFTASVHVQGVPECLRHRYPQDGSLCMWWGPDDESRRWVVADGLQQLAGHVARHLYQEAVCRVGDRWPGEESPGEHPRPSRCATCGGLGD